MAVHVVYLDRIASRLAYAHGGGTPKPNMESYEEKMRVMRRKR